MAAAMRRVSSPHCCAESSSTLSRNSRDSTCCSAWNSTRIRTMERPHFQAFQANFARQRMKESEEHLQDSQLPLGQQESQYFLSHHGWTASNEDFERLMSGPPQGLRLFNAQGPAFQQSAFSCPVLGSNWPQSAPPTVADPNNDVCVLESSEPAPASKKSKQKKAPTSKKRAPKKAKTTSVELSEDENDKDDGTGPTRWSDAQVQQLIAFRSEMDGEFKKNSKKQGYHMWDKLQGQMVVACDDFNKSEEACRKKWKVIYKQYCVDKRLLNISGNQRKITCKFFDDIDAGFNNTANVKKFAHGDAKGSDNPCPLYLNEDVPHEGPPIRGTPPSEKTPSQKGPKKSMGEMMTAYMGDMVSQTSTIAQEIKETTSILRSITNQFERLVDKL